MKENHFTEKDRETLTKLEVKLDRAIDDLKAFATNYVPINAFLTYQESTNTRLDKLEKDSGILKDFSTSWAGKVWGINSTIAVVVSALAFLVNHFWSK